MWDEALTRTKLNNIDMNFLASFVIIWLLLVDVIHQRQLFQPIPPPERRIETNVESGCNHRAPHSSSYVASRSCRGRLRLSFSSSGARTSQVRIGRPCAGLPP